MSMEFHSARRSFSRTYVRGEVLTQAANAMSKGLGVANSLIVLSALSVFHFGLYQLILSAAAIAESMSAGLFDDVVITDTARGLAEDRRPESKRLFNQFAVFKIGVGAAMAVALFAGAEVVAAFYDRDIAGLVRIASALVLVSTLRATEEIFFIASVSFSWLWTQTVLEVSKLALLVSFLAVGGFGVRQVLVAAVGASLVALLFSSIFFIPEYRRAFAGVSSAPANLLLAAGKRYGMWVSLRYGFGKVIKNIRPWLIKFLLNTEAVALYALGVNIISLAQGLMPIGMLGRLLPWELKDAARFRFIFLRSVKYALWIGLAMAILGAVILPPLIILILPKYAPAMPVLLALLLTLPPYGVYKIHKSVLGVLREQKVLSLRVMTEAGLVVGLNAVLLPLIGIVGVGVECALTYAWRILFFHRELVRRRPELAIKLKYLFSVDAADREFFGRVMSELTRVSGRVGQAFGRS